MKKAKMSNASGRIHVTRKATGSEIRNAVGVTEVHNRSAEKALREASHGRVVNSSNGVSGKDGHQVTGAEANSPKSTKNSKDVRKNK